MTPPHSSADFPEDPLISDSENFALSPADAAAIDALVEAGFEAVNVSSDSGGRVLHAASFLNALGAGLPATSETDSLLIHATLARVAREARIASIDRALGVGSGAVLSEPDREAVDALLDASFDSDATPEPVRARAHRAARLISLVNAGTGPTNAESLIQQTLARAQHAADEQDRMLNFEAEQERMATRRLRFSDAVAVAAVLAIGTAVLGPTLGVVRDASRKASCQANLMAAGIGFGLYAGENSDSLPLATSSPAGWKWWSVGQPEYSNSANLFTITRTGHARLEDLACAGSPSANACRERVGEMDWREFDAVTYSFQNLFAPPGARTKWNQSSGPVVVLVDRSPVTVRAYRGQAINPFANSANHNEGGQNVLMNDGTVVWITSPVLPGGDNIWIPQDVEALIERLSSPTQADPLKGTEAPRRPDDVFVGP